jgi:GntR family transcriptional repressor for pyruvate dehydrogenase complex
MPTNKPDAGKSHEVAVHLEEQILRSGLRPGWRLPSEEQLCRTHDVSRTVVREAVQQVKARGLVTSRRGGGTYVAPMDESVPGRAMLAYAVLAESDASFDHLLELRALLESAGVREMTRRRDKEAVARLKARIDALRKTREAPEHFAEAELEFRRCFASESVNALNAALLLSITESLKACVRRATLVPGSRDRLISDHEALYEAVRTGNADAAAALSSAGHAREKAELVAARRELRA